MVRRTGGLVVACVIALAGCGPEVVELAELDEVCGHESPFRILELDREVPIAGYYGVQAIGDRVYYVVERGDSDGPQHVPGAVDDGLPERSVVYSTGPCGESRRMIATDVWRVFEDEHWPGVLFGSTGNRTGDVVVLDAMGVQPPRIFLREVVSVDRWLDHGVLSFTPDQPVDEPATVWLHPYPATIDAAPPEPVRLFDEIPAAYSNVDVGGDEVLAMRNDGTLTSLDLVDGTRTTVLEGVGRFDVSDDGQLLVWESRPATDAPDETRSTYLVDRSTGTQTWLADSTASQSWPHIYEIDDPSYIDLRSLDPPDTYEQRIVMLPGLEQFDAPEATLLWFRLEDGRWIGDAEPQRTIVYDPATAHVEVIFDGYAAVGWVGADDAHVLEMAEIASSPYDRHTGRVWGLSYDGGEPELLARRATTGYVRLADRRVLTPLEIDAQYLADLVVVEPETLTEQHIDDHVFAATWWGALAELHGDDVINYAVHDGDRSGVWLARLPAVD